MEACTPTIHILQIFFFFFEEDGCKKCFLPKASFERMVSLHKVVMKTSPANTKSCSSGKESMPNDVLYCVRPEGTPKLGIQFFTKANMNYCT